MYSTIVKHSTLFAAMRLPFANGSKTFAAMLLTIVKGIALFAALSSTLAKGSKLIAAMLLTITGGIKAKKMLVWLPALFNF